MCMNPDHNRDPVYSNAVDEEKESIADIAAHHQGAADKS